MTNFLQIIGTLILAGLSATLYFFRKGGIYNPREQQIDSPSVPFNHVPDASVSPSTLPTKPLSNVTATPVSSPPSASGTLLWDTPKQAYHSTRVICDEMGLTLEQKNILCACIFQESRFNNHAVGRNKDKNGNTLSTDWGIVQCNDFYNIGTGKPFPSVDYVLANPEKMVRWMIKCYQSGQLHLWASYSSGAYLVWLKSSSPMWLLKS